jgi:hydroxymethylbilane synthase
LAQWQADLVKTKLADLGIKSHLVLIESQGDQDQIKPLYEMGVTGVFTRILDTALLNDRIDIAVHSMKDVPVLLPEGITEYAVLERGETLDILVKNNTNLSSKKIATSSLRRKSQWLNKYPDFTIESIRGNVNTRLQKVNDNEWLGAIFAKAGLERINILPENYEVLDWMIPAPAQGAIMIVGKNKDEKLLSILNKLNHESTSNCVKIERQVLRNLEGGCTAPIAVIVEEMDTTYKVKAGIYSLCGKRKVEIEEYFPIDRSEVVAEIVSDLLKKNGGLQILKEIKTHNDSAR